MIDTMELAKSIYGEPGFILKRKEFWKAVRSLGIETRGKFLNSFVTEEEADKIKKLLKGGKKSETIQQGAVG